MTDKNLSVVGSTEELYQEPSIFDVVTGNARVENLASSIIDKGIGFFKRKAISKTRGLAGGYGARVIDYVSNRAKYNYVKNFVGMVLADNISDRRIHEVPYNGGNIGEHRGLDVYIPRASDIPKVFGDNYHFALAQSGKSQGEFNKDIQAYVKAHELVESWYMGKYGIERLSDEEHGEIEALMLEGLKHYQKLGNKRAGDIYRAATITHNARSNDDVFKNITTKYDIGGLLKAA